MAGYAKLYSTITESSLWSESKEVRLLFVSMLARANASGFVEAAIPGLARVSNLTVSEVEAALAVLEGPDKHSKRRSTNDDGRRLERMLDGWKIVNYEHYRHKLDVDDRREYERKYRRKYRLDGRDKSRVNSGQLLSTRSTQAEAEAEAEALGIPKGIPCQVDAVVAAWNSAKGATPIRKLTTARKKTLATRLKDASWDWQAAIAKFPLKCFGTEAGGWTPNFDWFLRPDTVMSILEGKYDWSKTQNGKQRSGRVIHRCTE